MSQPSCDACANLREDNASFIMNGVTDTVANSLKNNTGFNPTLTSLHTDCEDLSDANDCLIGHMDDDLDNFEICDLKDFLHNLLPNLYEMLKAMIAAICGLWAKTESIEDMLCDYLSPSYTVVPVTVGQHQYNDSAYWQDDGNATPRTLCMKISKTKFCNNKMMYEIGLVWKETDGITNFNGKINAEIPFLSDAASNTYCTRYTHDDLVPKYLSEQAWDVLHNSHGISGGPTAIVGNLTETASYISTYGLAYLGAQNFIDIGVEAYIGSGTTTGGVARIDDSNVTKIIVNE